MKWLLPFLFTPLLSANDTAMHDGGSGPEPVGWTKGEESVIRMVREEITVEMNPFDSTVHCRFVFMNTKKDAPATQQLGFPDITRSDFESDTVGPLKEMRSFVNGKEVESELVSKESEDFGKQSWHVITVTFPPGEEVVVERRFRTENGATAGGPNFFGYTTRTGGNWQGAIGKGTFTVHLAEGMQKAKLELEPREGWQKSEDGRTLTLEWKEFEPRTDEDRCYWSVGWFYPEDKESEIGIDVEIREKLERLYQDK